MIKTLKKMVVERSAESQGDPVANGPDEVPREKNIFKVEIVEGRREKKLNPVEVQLNSWLTTHLEDKEGAKVNSGALYEHYLEGCVTSGGSATADFEFYRALRNLFPKGYTVREDSPLHGVLKERKIQPKSTVKAESLNLKMKDIVNETLEESGNPNRGVHFRVIRSTLAAKYPALRLDLKPHLLKNSLNLGVRQGRYELVRGMGACGFYRLYGMPSTVEEPEKKKKKLDKGEIPAEGEDGEGAEGEKEEGTKKKGKKRSSGAAAEEGEGKEDEKEGEEGEPKKKKRKGKEEEKEEEGEPKKKKRKKSAKKQKKRSQVVHSEPKRIEDTFLLAFTYNNEPKEASVAKIRHYIQRFYPDTNVDTVLRKQLDAGLEKGYWSLSRGSQATGSYLLEIDEFDPTDDDDTIGKIVNAIMASSEPKVSSANLLKKYLIEYHPEFKVEQRQHFFVKAIERAINNNIIRRVSGIGASGSFQLAEKFVPSPAVLAGQDTESDYEEELSEGEDVVTPSGRSQVFTMEMFQDKYVPRPSKRRGMARQGTTVEKWNYDEDYDETVKVKPSAGTVRKPPTVRKDPVKKPVTKAAKKKKVPTATLR